VLLENIWKKFHPNNFSDDSSNHLIGNKPSPYIIEVTSMLERALNFAHTGNTRVLTRNLMDYSWLSLGCIIDGFPALSSRMMFLDNILTSSLEQTPNLLGWPLQGGTNIPLTASQSTLEYNYGTDFYAVRLTRALSAVSFTHYLQL
jgi:hypothetical protein